MANPSPDTSGLTPFPRGTSPNPGGKTSKQRQAEVQAAENAAILRAKMTSKLLERVEAGEDVTQFIDTATLKLFKDSEDRAHGMPKQTIDNSSTEGTMSPKARGGALERITKRLSNAALTEIVELNDAAEVEALANS